MKNTLYVLRQVDRVGRVRGEGSGQQAAEQGGRDPRRRAPRQERDAVHPRRAAGPRLLRDERGE